jgi:hypothetical protein
MGINEEEEILEYEEEEERILEEDGAFEVRKRS